MVYVISSGFSEGEHYAIPNNDPTSQNTRVPPILGEKTTENENEERRDYKKSVGGTDVVRVSVCTSCQHLYDGQTTVVLTPTTLTHDHATIFTHDHPTTFTHDHANHLPKMAKVWAARRYEGLCVCAETGISECVCATNRPGVKERIQGESVWGLILPRNASWWPRTKFVLLIIAAIIPWACLITYVVFVYKR